MASNIGVNLILILLNDKKERKLFLPVIMAFLVLIIVELQLPLLPVLKDTAIENILCSESLKNISSGLLIGLISAYIFYILIDFLPRKRREEKTIDLLDSLIASILDSYERCRIFGHETAISHVDKSTLNTVWFDDQISKLKSNNSKFLSLKFAMQTAYTRTEDFRHTLPLAVSLSPEHAMQWLIIIDKVRLMAESYGEEVNIPKEKQHLVDQDIDENPVRLYKSTLNLRFLEIVEQSKGWHKLTKSGS
ncbi:hypothetical protein MED121_16099 [Marinomonas sp. MED121]|nr:hypothetical protein MED121_16099 [Marinomonas sp. MED121]